MGTSPLGQVLLTYAYKTMTKKKMIFYCNNTWLMYNLDSGEWVFKLLYCNYAQDFMTLHNKDAGLKGN